MLKQVSIYAENKRGTMERLTAILAENDINILGSVTNDSAEYGIIRMIVTDADKAVECLTKDGFFCKKTEVLGVEVTDEVGNLNKLLKACDAGNINIDYLYLSFNRKSGRPIMVFHADDPHEVELCLQAKGFTMTEA